MWTIDAVPAEEALIEIEESSRSAEEALIGESEYSLTRTELEESRVSNFFYEGGLTDDDVACQLGS